MGFNNFIPLYREAGGILAEGKVGNADSKITDMKKTLEVELEVLKKDPTFFFCDNPGCRPCRIGWEFSTGTARSVKFHQTVQRLQRLRRRLAGRTVARSAGG